MSVNKYAKHILVLPEDDANRQVANGFILEPKLNDHVIQILAPAGGWTKLLDSFRNNHSSEMRKYPQRMILLIIDFDNKEGRPNKVKDQIPKDLTARVFFLGAQSEPKNLKITLQDSTPLKRLAKLSHRIVSRRQKIFGGIIYLNRIKQK